jgi:3-hydroxybutyrate dehydrogenase
MSSTSLDGRLALVTGGGRGAGAAIAQALARAGAAVVVTARTAAEIDAVAERLRAAGSRAWSWTCDVSSEASVAALTETVAAQAGPVDILVNNAGIARAAPLARITLDDWNTLLGVNATGTFLCTRAFLPAMAARGWGRVVNIASTAGLSGDRYIAAYAASKHAVVGFTRSVAAEVAAHGVTVNAVCPTYLDTPMTEASIDRVVEVTGRSRADALEALIGRTPQRRLISPDEVAATVRFLCSDDARGITGSAVALDGGELRR